MQLFIDVHSKKPYPANALSNYFPHRFEMDGLEITCMEAFLQSTKCPDIAFQKVICQKMTAKEAKAVGATYDWKSNGMLYWQGYQFSRYSMEYWRLLMRAYGKLCEVPAFQRAMSHSGHKILFHSVGRWSRKDTCLTTWEFLLLLYWCRIVIRKNKKENDKC